MSAAAPRFPGDGRELTVHTDRHGGSHRERRPEARGAEPRMERVEGSLERAWQDPARRDELRAQALARPNPHVEPDPRDPSQSAWTWNRELFDPMQHAVVPRISGPPGRHDRVRLPAYPWSGVHKCPRVALGRTIPGDSPRVWFVS